MLMVWSCGSSLLETTSTASRYRETDISALISVDLAYGKISYPGPNLMQSKQEKRLTKLEWNVKEASSPAK